MAVDDSSVGQTEKTEVQRTGSADGLIKVTRPARALIGWMAPEQARLSLAGRRMDQVDRQEFAERVERAHLAVASRSPGVDQTLAVSPLPDALSGHIDSLRQNPLCAQYFRESWQIAMVDLSAVCAAQPHVYTDHATERVVGVDPADVTSLARVSLPIPVPTTTLAAQFDESKQAWIFSSPNPNLRIAGHFQAQAQPGVNVFGFAVALSASFLQVAIYRDRYLLRDGYHRAFGFLKSGITRVPAFVKEFTTFDELALPRGMLSLDAFLGDRPPLLPDYLNDEVSAEVVMPATQRVVLIQGLELNTLG